MTLARFGYVCFFASSLSGCNAVAHAQVGPVFAASRIDPVTATAETPRRYSGGGELNGTIDLDIAAASEWLDSRPPPEHAGRFGPSAGVYLRGTSEGVGVGAREGAFIAGTNADWTGRLGAVVDLGVASYEGRPYGAIGLTAAATGGFTIAKSYDPNAYVLCRSITYLTFTLEGSYQRLPDGPQKGVDVLSAALLIGVASLDDAGSPGDAVNATTRCPR